MRRYTAARGEHCQPPPVVRRRVALGAADAPAERDAERLADAVVRSDVVGADIGLGTRAPTATDNESTAHHAGGLHGTGRLLPPALRSRFEPRFGTDLGAVRIHRDAAAADAAAALNARAFTVGRHIYFGAGRWRPGTAVGDRLIAHELAHVIQQRAAGRDGRTQQPIRRQADEETTEDADRGWPWRLGETEGEKRDTGESPGLVWRWLTWAGIGFLDFIAGALEWLGIEDYDIAADLLRHYMSGRGADYQLDMPAEWASAIASRYTTPGTYHDVSSYKWGIPDLRNSLGHFDLTVIDSGNGGRTYVVKDRYHFPYIENDKWEQGRHGFQVPPFGDLPAGIRVNVNKALAALGVYSNPGGFDERFEVKIIDGEWTFLIPQQFLADSGVDFTLYSTFGVPAGGTTEADEGWWPLW